MGGCLRYTVLAAHIHRMLLLCQVEESLIASSNWYLCSQQCVYLIFLALILFPLFQLHFALLWINAMLAW